MAGFLVANILICIIQCLVFVYDIITFPVYFLVQRPWKKWALMNRKHAEVVGSGDHEITLRSVGEKYSLVLEAEQK